MIVFQCLMVLSLRESGVRLQISNLENCCKNSLKDILQRDKVSDYRQANSVANSTYDKTYTVSSQQVYQNSPSSICRHKSFRSDGSTSSHSGELLHKQHKYLIITQCIVLPCYSVFSFLWLLLLLLFK